MNHKQRMHALLKECCDVLHAYIASTEADYPERWVPAAQLKQDLELNFDAYPAGGEQHGKTGWCFAILARMLEDANRIEYKKVGARSYCRTRTPG